MGIYKRPNSKYWQIEIQGVSGKRTRISSGTENKQEALELEAKLNHEQWANQRLGQKIPRSWPEAVNRWLNEKEGVKKTIENDIIHLRWLSPYLNHLTLNEITKDKIAFIVQERRSSRVIKTNDPEKRAEEERNRKPITNASINRMLEVIRAILKLAQKDWEWIDKIPSITLLKEPKGRTRWITKEQSIILFENLPEHKRACMLFALASGLRESNVLGLTWSRVDLDRRHAYVEGTETKNKEAIPVPLNKTAMAILVRQQRIALKEGISSEYVFTYKGNKIGKANTLAWRKALKRAQIDDFRWHDLRHTWASWHAQAGTSLQALMDLGRWASLQMVLRYAHLSSDHLKEAAERTTCAELTHMLDDEEDKYS